MVSIVGARCFAPDIGHAPRAPTMQGAQKLRREAHLQVRRNNEVEAQRSRWTFYETINSIFIALSPGKQRQLPVAGAHKTPQES